LRPRGLLGQAHWNLRHEGLAATAGKLVRAIPWIVRRAHVAIGPLLPARAQRRAGLPGADHRFLAGPLFHVSASELQRSSDVQRQARTGPVTSATWFVSHFDHLAFGGIYTIFRFISGFAERGVHNRIVIFDRKTTDPAEVKAAVVRAFPSLAAAEIIVFNQEAHRIEDLPPSDVAFCTFWVSAYVLLRYNQTGRKYYFIQDYEPAFYPAGSMYALAQSTYRFGFEGIVNTPGLMSALRAAHGLDGVSFVPAVDERFFFPAPRSARGGRLRVFFYVRPNNSRNAFELVTIIMRLLNARYGDRIEIVTAGSDWSERDHGLRGKVTNLGLLGTLESVGALYRSCDIGVVYMLSKHPSYQPFEFMACGMATVTNRNEDNLWFLKDAVNCLIAEPSPVAMAEQIGRLIEDPELLATIKEGGARSVDGDWPARVEMVWNEISRR